VEPGIATNLIVFSRGLDVGSNITLSQASRSRVEAALAHIAAHADLFTARSASSQRGRVVFSGGWASAAADMPRLPEQLREGRLMLDLARAVGVNDASLGTYVDAFAEIESNSTLENTLRVAEGSWFADRTFTAADPLGIVAHAEHMVRVEYFVRKAFGLARSAVQHIVARGEDRMSRGTPEETLHLLTRVACFGAVTPGALRRRERLMLGSARLLAIREREPGSPTFVRMT
jgi:hypothetical protein